MSRQGSFVLQNEISSGLEKWHNLGVWDNEQVMLRNILPMSNIRTLYIPQLTGTPGAVARTLRSGRVANHVLSSFVLHFLLSRGKQNH